MEFIINVFGKVVQFLPNSFILTQLVAYDEELQPLYHAISVLNWFIPFQFVVGIFSGWAVSMCMAVLGYHFYKKM